MYFFTHTIKKISAILLLSTVGFFAVYISVNAHTTGSFWQTKVGEYYVDIGYDPTIFVAKQYARFDFNLLKNANDTDSLPFAEVWIRIKRDKETLLATGVRKQPIGPTTLLYSFESSGQYSLEASFRDTEGNEISAASFPITVTPQEGGSTSENIQRSLFLLFGVVIGAGGMFLARTTFHTSA